MVEIVAIDEKRYRKSVTVYNSTSPIKSFNYIAVYSRLVGTDVVDTAPSTKLFTIYSCRPIYFCILNVLFHISIYIIETRFRLKKMIIVHLCVG